MGFYLQTEAQNTIYFEDFENATDNTYQDTTYSLSGLTNWDYMNSFPTIGRLRTNAGAGFPYSGSRALTLDVNTDNNNNTNHVIKTLDMSSFSVTDTIYLSFWYMSHGDETDIEDRVSVRGDSTDPWLTLYNLDPGSLTSGAYSQVTNINISAVLAANAQSYTSTFQMRFTQYDNYEASSTTGTDGITFDDIHLYKSVENELSVDRLISPADTVGRQYTSISFDSNEVVTVEVSNNGTQDQTNVPIYFRLSPGSLVKDTIPSILSGQTINFSFTERANMWTPDVYDITEWVDLAADTVPSNDTVSQSGKWQIQNPIRSLSYAENFNTSNVDTFQNNVIGVRSSKFYEWDYMNSSSNGRMRIHPKPGFYESAPSAVTMGAEQNLGVDVDNYLR
jgi:hypothetical protein